MTTGADQMDNITKAYTEYASRYMPRSASCKTEEATKTSLVLPFLQTVLGYDIFDPAVVEPEYTADYATKQGEKVDYAVKGADGSSHILIEAKCVGASLDKSCQGQLFRYFSTEKSSSSLFGCLTNGVVWKFYTDLNFDNLMDDEPFAVIDFSAGTAPSQDVLELLSLMSSGSQKWEAAHELAHDIVVLDGLRCRLNREMDEPSDELVKILLSDEYDDVDQDVSDKDRELVKRALCATTRKQRSMSDDEQAKKTSSEENKCEGSPTSDTPPSKRRPRMRFDQMGIPIGAKLTFYDDPSRSVIVADGNTQVTMENGNTTALSNAARSMCIEMGMSTTSGYRGSDHFIYRGELLTKRKERMEAEQDQAVVESAASMFFDEPSPDVVPSRKVARPTRFSEIDVPIGATLTWTVDTSQTVSVVDGVNHVKLEDGREMTLSAAAKELFLLRDPSDRRGHYAQRGPHWFAYEGETIMDRRTRLEAEAADNGHERDV